MELDTRSVVKIQGVSVRYRLPQERIPSFKEYAIRWLKGQVRYHELWALRNISLEIRSGEVFGIVGPNGAGKSTLLKVIARVLRPTSGTVYVRGRVAPLLELGAGFEFELTGRENIYLNGTILGFSKRHIDSRIDHIIEFAGLRDFIDVPVRTYSTGMVARLGFAIAADERPDILIVDEILSVGDAEFQTRSFERIQSFQAEGTTILLVSHGLGKVEEMCSRVMWLDHGEVVSLGDPRTVINSYLGKVRDDEAERLAHQKEDESPRRWGSQRVEITRAYLTDETGNEQMVFFTGQKMALHIEYQAHEPIQSPIFGMAVHRQDGAHLTGPNSFFNGYDFGEIRGRGAVIFTVPFLPILEGMYRISVAITNHEDTEIFDYHDRTVPFRVFNRGQLIQEKYGLMTFNGQWQHQGTDEQKKGR